jgi:two-component system, OmpR family, KDP operon response regulator KdpE
MGLTHCITKPFGMGELMARIRVDLRHVAPQQDESIVRVGSLTVDFARRTVEQHREPVRLPRLNMTF